MSAPTKTICLVHVVRPARRHAASKHAKRLHTQIYTVYKLLPSRVRIPGCNLPRCRHLLKQVSIDSSLLAKKVDGGSGTLDSTTLEGGRMFGSEWHHVLYSNVATSNSTTNFTSPLGRQRKSLRSAVTRWNALCDCNHPHDANRVIQPPRRVAGMPYIGLHAACLRRGVSVLVTRRCMQQDAEIPPRKNEISWTVGLQPLPQAVFMLARLREPRVSRGIKFDDIQGGGKASRKTGK
ncbi:hypothetical protein GE09DRAFT_208127 [Coniochaeta sp. 2T2.1]|nr:hypothetical protein GE09DRAFT_208127 [Coniochaeta sp. 2T2.1]